MCQCKFTVQSFVWNLFESVHAFEFSKVEFNSSAKRLLGIDYLIILLVWKSLHGSPQNVKFHAWYIWISSSTIFFILLEYLLSFFFTQLSLILCLSPSPERLKYSTPQPFIHLSVSYCTTLPISVLELLYTFRCTCNQFEVGRRLKKI